MQKPLLPRLLMPLNQGIQSLTGKATIGLL
jgi:hypothetical protein